MTPREVAGWLIVGIIAVILFWLVLELMEEDDPGYVDLGPYYEEIAG